jgi:subtilisin family serine protease
MRIGSLSLPLKLVVLTALILTFAGSSTAALNSQNVTTTISGSYIVHFDDETSASQVKAAVVEVVSAMQTIQQQLIADGVIQGSAKVAIEVPSDRIFTESINGFLINGISEEMLPSLLKTSGAINVESDAVTKIDTVEGEKKGKDGNQRLRSMQEVQITPWGVSRVGGPIDISTVPYPLGRIFVMDTGISKNTKDLTIDEWLSTNFAPDYYGNYDPWDWQDYNGHGTHVAGIIAALNNGINVVGVVPGATVVAVKVCSVTNCRYSDIIAGIEHVAKYGAKGDVVNIGFSGFSFSGTHVLNAAVQNTASRGIKFAIEAGDYFSDAKYFVPASASGNNIYTVSCYDSTDTSCWSSNYGETVDVAGPGDYIPSLSTDGYVSYWSGTAMSAAHIAGLLFADSYMVDGYTQDYYNHTAPIWVYAGDIPTPAPTLASDEIVFFIHPDLYSENETSWNLTRNSPGPPTVVASAPVGSYPGTGDWTTTVSNLDVGTYRFDIFDEFGDGLIPPAYYTLSFANGVLLKTGGVFKDIDTTFFTVTSSSSGKTNSEKVSTTFQAAPISQTTRPPAPTPSKAPVKRATNLFN